MPNMRLSSEEASHLATYLMTKTGDARFNKRRAPKVDKNLLACASRGFSKK